MEKATEASSVALAWRFRIGKCTKRAFLYSSEKGRGRKQLCLIKSWISRYIFVKDCESGRTNYEHDVILEDVKPEETLEIVKHRVENYLLRLFPNKYDMKVRHRIEYDFSFSDAPFVPISVKANATENDMPILKMSMAEAAEHMFKHDPPINPSDYRKIRLKVNMPQTHTYDYVHNDGPC